MFFMLISALDISHVKVCHYFKFHLFVPELKKKLNKVLKGFCH